ncbi:MAG: hypothetical protein ABS48_01630 [Erythrobacter sp. SCN 68-10]|nr:MAG: hypothetical protein ABS48_01630 [Erythrobacter sp. SCN 68-10]
MREALAPKPLGRWADPSASTAAGPGERRWPAEGGPAIVSPEPPVAWADYPALFAMAEQMLDTRRERLPARVAAGELAQDEADRELAAFADLVADWRYICTGEGEPAGIASEQARRDALDQAIIRIAVFAGEHGGFSRQLHEQAERVIALRWHLEPGRRTLAMARITHELRAEIRATKGGPADA